jgi:hypothetical protein
VKGPTNAGAQLILRAGAEGGSISLFRERSSNGWRYWCESVDQTTLMLDEHDVSGQEIRRVSDKVDTWEQALSLLDQRRWARLFPVLVDPYFAQQVLQAVTERLGADASWSRTLERWRERCEPSRR